MNCFFSPKGLSSSIVQLAFVNILFCSVSASPIISVHPVQSVFNLSLFDLVDQSCYLFLFFISYFYAFAFPMKLHMFSLLSTILALLPYFDSPKDEFGTFDYPNTFSNQTYTFIPPSCYSLSHCSLYFLILSFVVAPHLLSIGVHNCVTVVRTLWPIVLLYFVPPVVAQDPRLDMIEFEDEIKLINPVNLEVVYVISFCALFTCVIACLDSCHIVLGVVCVRLCFLLSLCSFSLMMNLCPTMMI